MYRQTSKIMLTCAALLLAGVFCGCAPQLCFTEPYNPMREIWASTAAQVIQLKKIQATRTQWTKAADSATQISTLAQLRTAIATTGTPADDTERQRRYQHLERLFRASHSTVHFSWEGDFNAIVFFDAKGRQKYVHPRAWDRLAGP